MESATTNNTSFENPQFNLIEELQEKSKSNQKLLRDGKFDEAIEAYRDCCEKAYFKGIGKKNKNLIRRQIYLDEMHPEMAKFYYFYGNAVLFKVKKKN